MNEFDHVLGQFYGSVIESVDFDLLTHKISLKVKVYMEEETYDEYDVVLNEVVGFAWEYDRTELYEWDYLELTTLDTIEEGTQLNFVGEKFFENFKCLPKICFEIWGSILVVDCSMMTVNGKSFSLK